MGIMGGTSHTSICAFDSPKKLGKSTLQNLKRCTTIHSRGQSLPTQYFMSCDSSREIRRLSRCGAPGRGARRGGRREDDARQASCERPGVCVGDHRGDGVVGRTEATPSLVAPGGPSWSWRRHCPRPGAAGTSGTAQVVGAVTCTRSKGWGRQ